MTPDEIIATLEDVNDQAGFGTDFLRMEEREEAWWYETSEADREEE